jgi:hypothetical protein
MTRRILLGFSVGLVLFFGCLPAASRAQTRLPARLSDQEFWRLSTSASEPNGFFRSDNLTSNELLFEHVIPDLIARTRPGGVYLGVGPEQNYTYIAAVKPAMVVIFDIRRGNMLLQLMYKAIFELSKDRADFVSMLFSRPRPAGLNTKSTAADIFAAFAAVPPSATMYRENLSAVNDRLTKTHGIQLSPEDLSGIEYVFNAFYVRGYAVRAAPQYDELMTAADATGARRSYLASEANFMVMKDLEARNLVVPVVGDFAGPKAIRAIGIYLKEHNATVSAFYLSNVEQYLYQDSKWGGFCRNVATLPLDRASTFIRSENGRGVGANPAAFRGPGFVSSLGAMVDDIKSCIGG